MNTNRNRDPGQNVRDHFALLNVAVTCKQMLTPEMVKKAKQISVKRFEFIINRGNIITDKFGNHRKEHESVLQESG